MAAPADTFGALRSVCDAAVSANVIPGGVVLCAREGRTRFHEAFGARAIAPHHLPATRDTIYDIASLTKAVVTSALAMHAVAAGTVSLDDPVQRHLPEFEGPGKSGVTVRHLLCHASGLPAHRPFYEQVAADGAQGRSRIVLAAAREPLLGIPGALSVYSDVGFILLGWILERAGGARLDALAKRALFDPLGLSSMGFVDTGDDAAKARLLARQPVAPTEDCPVRGGIVHGEVHDLNAFAMGGVAGHAGLFSDAADLSRLAAALWSAWRGGGPAPIVERAVIQEFWRAAGIPASMWRLGWDGPAAHGSQGGSRLSREAVGHLGFTGCSLWIDPGPGWWVVLLTNRVHPTVRPDPRFRELRAAVHDAAIDGLAAG